MRGKRYVLTESSKKILLERYDGTSATINELIPILGAPRRKLVAWARELGLANDRKIWPWTEEEDRYLETFFHRTSMDAMVKHLKRSRASISRRATQLGITKCGEGYLLEGLLIAFGCTAKRVNRWINEGWLKGSRRQTQYQHDYWYFSEEAVRTFVKEHRLEVALTKPDVAWLIGLLSDEE